MTQTKKLSSKGWAKQAPGTRERKIMRKKCGSKCFLGPKISFPICPKGTCKPNSKGMYAAYVRARQYGSKRSRSKRSRSKRSRTKRHTKKMYQSIATKAKTMLKKRGFNLK